MTTPKDGVDVPLPSSIPEPHQPSLHQRSLDAIKMLLHGREVMTEADRYRINLTIEALNAELFPRGVDVPRTDHIRSVPGGAAFLRVAGNAGVEASDSEGVCTGKTK